MKARAKRDHKHARAKAHGRDPRSSNRAIRARTASRPRARIRRRSRRDSAKVRRRPIPLASSRSNLRNGTVPVTHRNAYGSRAAGPSRRPRARPPTVAARIPSRNSAGRARDSLSGFGATTPFTPASPHFFFPPFFPAGSPHRYGGSRFQVKPPTRARGFRSRVANAEQTERLERPPVFHTSRRAARTARRTFSRGLTPRSPSVRPAPSSSSSSRPEAKKAPLLCTPRRAPRSRSPRPRRNASG